VNIQAMLREEQLKYAAPIRHALPEVLPECEVFQGALNDWALRPRHCQSVGFDLDARQAVEWIGYPLTQHENPKAFARQQRCAQKRLESGA
jgi:hypothetical protein